MSNNSPPPMGHNGFTFETRDDLPNYVKKNMRFFKCDADALLLDVLKMPLDQRGLYMTAILLMYRDLDPLPADDKAAAMALQIDVRQYRHLKPSLVKPGLLYMKPSGRISNARWEKEISEFVMKHRAYSAGASKRAENRKAKAVDPTKDVAGTPASTSPVPEGLPARILDDTDEDFSKKFNEINEAVAKLKEVVAKNEGKNKEKKKEEEKKEEQRSLLRRSGETQADVAQRLLDRLVTASNGAIGDPAKIPGLMSCSTILMWMESGADPDKDIIPTVVKVATGAKGRGKKIHSWDYFTQSVAEAKAKRIAGLPEVQVQGGQKPLSLAGLTPEQRIRAEEAMAAAKARQERSHV